MVVWWFLKIYFYFMCHAMMIYPLVICYSLLLNMAIKIVDLPNKTGDFP